MEYNICKTCKAKDSKAGMLINDECLNCYHTRRDKKITLHTHLSRTEEEIEKTFSILT